MGDQTVEHRNRGVCHHGERNHSHTYGRSSRREMNVRVSPRGSLSSQCLFSDHGSSSCLPPHNQASILEANGVKEAKKKEGPGLSHRPQTTLHLLCCPRTRRRTWRRTAERSLGVMINSQTFSFNKLLLRNSFTARHHQGYISVVWWTAYNEWMEEKTWLEVLKRFAQAVMDAVWLIRPVCQTPPSVAVTCNYYHQQAEHVATMLHRHLYTWICYEYYYIYFYDYYYYTSIT